MKRHDAVPLIEPGAPDALPQTLGPIPWRARDLTRWTLATWVGLTAVVVAWFGASGSAELDVQYRWLNLAIGGTVVTGAANVVWLLNGLRAVRERRHGLIAALLEDDPLPQAEPARPTEDVRTLVAASNMTRYHRGDCPLVRGKTVVVAELRSHRRAGRLPCGVCQSTDSTPIREEVAA